MTGLFSSIRAVKKRFSPYRTLVEVFIFKDKLLHNLNKFKKAYSNLSFAPVLKSNAYGHGLTEVAKILDNEQLAFLCVDSLYEARILRKAGIKSKILILGYTDPENISFSNLHEVSFVLTALEQLQATVQKLKSKKKFHLKIDTGMHRQGILPEQIEQAVKLIKSSKYIELEGVCSHFADSDSEDQQFTELQIKKWREVTATLKDNFKDLKYLHVANTAGVYYSNRFESNVARIGAGLYGTDRSPFQKLNLEPVLEMHSLISSVKVAKAGARVGYNLTYKAGSDITVATVPVGYFEGVDRKLSNCGFFEVGGVVCPIIGTVSMNITTIDVSKVPNVKAGDPVVLISSDPSAVNSVENIAKQIGTIGREILVHIPQHLRRTVI